MIRIVTDTAADITPAQARALQVELVPLTIHFGKTPYDPLKDDTFEKFYSLLRSERDLPTTSQPAPDSFLAVFKKAREAGDDVIAICLSSKLSGTYHSACIAQGMLAYDRVHVIDSRTLVTGQRLLVELAASLRDAGKSAEDIVAAVRSAAERVVLIAGLDTLKYLRKGGRIPKTMEMLGTIIGIKPIIQVVDGAIVMAGKARGKAGALQVMLDLVSEQASFDPAAPVYFGYTDTDEQCQAFKKMVTEKYGLTNTKVYPVGAVAGTHVGPGAFVIIYLKKA